MHVNDLAFERNKNNLKTKNIFFQIFRVDHVRLSNEYFFASCALEQQYTYVNNSCCGSGGKIPSSTTASHQTRGATGYMFIKTKHKNGNIFREKWTFVSCWT